VINADGDIWRFHRKVTGPVFSERIHRVVWQESKRQAKLMLDVWSHTGLNTAESVQVDSLADDTLRLGLHVITGSAYGCPLEWDDSPPHTGAASTLTYRRSLEQLTHHLMQVFLTPHWLLKLAPRDSTWGRAWEAYQAFGSYMEGMLARERVRMADGDADDNLLTHLIRAENEVDNKLDRPMNQKEVMGNAFIFLFAGEFQNWLMFPDLALKHIIRP
jgi:cytochrome P450